MSRARTYPNVTDGFPVNEVAGYYDHTVTRSTGTLVFLADTETFGLSVEDGGRFLLVCDPHGGILQGENAATARWFMRHPEQWCPTCMDDDEETGR